MAYTCGSPKTAVGLPVGPYKSSANKIKVMDMVTFLRLTHLEDRGKPSRRIDIGTSYRLLLLFVILHFSAK